MFDVYIYVERIIGSLDVTSKRVCSSKRESAKDHKGRLWTAVRPDTYMFLV